MPCAPGGGGRDLCRKLGGCAFGEVVQLARFDFPRECRDRVARQGVDVGVGASRVMFHCKVELHEADVPPRESPLEVDLLVKPDKWIVIHSSHECGSAV
jgi:hypothetical protein